MGVNVVIYILNLTLRLFLLCDIKRQLLKINHRWQALLLSFGR